MNGRFCARGPHLPPALASVKLRRIRFFEEEEEEEGAAAFFSGHAAASKPFLAGMYLIDCNIPYVIPSPAHGCVTHDVYFNVYYDEQQATPSKKTCSWNCRKFSGMEASGCGQQLPGGAAEGGYRAPDEGAAAAHLSARGGGEEIPYRMDMWNYTVVGLQTRVLPALSARGRG